MNIGIAVATCLALAHQPSQAPSFRSERENRALFVEKLRRDIAKVARSIEVTEALIARSRGAPYLPDIYLRLAELYVEQSRYEFYLVNEERGDAASGAAVAPTSRLLKEKAIETYRRILSDFAGWKNNDKVTFYLAHELRELGSYEAMIETYERLVRDFPKSDLVLDAYLVLGDYRFDKGDLPGAENWYQKILAAPPSPTHDIAHYKMGWVELNEAKFEAAFQHFEAAVKTPWAAPGEEGDDARRLDVKREAMVDLAYTFTDVKKSESALAYFRRLAPSRSVYVLTLEKLAGRYFVQENYPAAARIYRELAVLANNPAENLDRTAQVYRASIRSRRFPRVDQDVGGMLDAMDAYRFDWRVGADERDSAAKDIELQARDLATKAQQAALAKKDRALGPKVAAAYGRYLQSFPDSPKRAQILQNLADTLYESRRFLEAGDRYEEAALALSSEKAVQQALYNACAAFRQAIEVGGATMPRFDRLWAQRGLIQNGRTYVERFPDSPKVAEIELNIGRSYFEGGEFERAVGVFEEFIDTRPKDPRVQTIAELILDAYRLQKDYEGLADKARSLAKRGIGSAAFRRRLEATARSAEERQIGEVILTASVDAAGEDAGAQLRKYWAENQSSPLAERTLYTAFVQYKEARDHEKVFETGNQFIGAYPSSSYLGDVFGTLAAFSAEVGAFEQSAVYLEELESRFPKDASAQRQLARAAQIRKLLGDDASAAKAFLRLYVRASPTEKSTYAGPLLETLEALGRWDEVTKVARALGTRTPAAAVRSRLYLGLAAKRRGDLEAAAKLFVEAAQSAGRSAEGQVAEDAARAAFEVGQLIFERFRAATGLGDLASVTAAKVEALGELEATMVEVAGFGVGRYVVAGLHRVGLAFADMAGFLAEAPLPADLSAAEQAEYVEAVEAQVDNLEGRAEEIFSTCVERALALRVLTPETRGCVARGEATALPAVRGSPGPVAATRPEEIRSRLAAAPEDLEAIRTGVRVALAGGRFAEGKLMALRGLEIDDRDARLQSLLGAAELAQGRATEAYAAFARAAELGHPYALANQAALLADIGLQTPALDLITDADLDLPPQAVDLHPGAPALLERAR